MTSQLPTVVYVSCRKDNRIEWFLDGLAKQCGGDWPELIYIDFYAELPGRAEETKAKMDAAGVLSYITRTTKPNVWHGAYRLPKDNWFAAANVRNTALCLCRTSHICYIDDLTVLRPGWWEAVKRGAQLTDTITLGAYRKVRELVVEKGEIVSFDDSFKGGMDTRFHYGGSASRVPCNGDILYGCSLVAPVEALLSVGGWAEICDGLGSEDYCTGIVLQNAGWKFVYDKSLMTYESDELHFAEPPFKRCDKGPIGTPGDKSHAVLNIAKQSKSFPGYFEGGIRALRDHILAGGDFPKEQVPQHDWFDGQRIEEMACP